MAGYPYQAPQGLRLAAFCMGRESFNAKSLFCADDEHPHRDVGVPPAML